MKEYTMNRRTFLKRTGTAFAVLSGLELLNAQDIYAAMGAQNIIVPFSAGEEHPAIKVPKNACDCHMHIYDSRFLPSPHWKKKPPEAPVEAYRLLQKRLGTTRNIVVTPSTYGIDNSCTVDALQQLGKTARGVAVVDTTVTDAELHRLHAAGVRGIRVNFVSAQSWGVTTADMLETLAHRVHIFGWHVQILMSATQIVEMQSVLNKLPVPIVFDHLGRIPQPEGIDHPAVKVLLKLMDQGKTWMKLSGAYMDTKIGAPAYSDVTKVAQKFVANSPERVVWGSDWPHPTENIKPDDAVLMNLLAAWAPSEKIRHRILVENPEELYGF